MRDPQEVLRQARRASVPPTWRVLTRRRGAITGFLHGTSNDPDPLLVLTPEGSVEYVEEKKPLGVVDFGDLSAVRMRVRGSSFSDSTLVRLDVWVDLHYLDGGKRRWRPPPFGDELDVVQYFIEAYGAHKALRGGT